MLLSGKIILSVRARVKHELRDFISTIRFLLVCAVLVALILSGFGDCQAAGGPKQQISSAP
jgi:hypothetical protein